RYFDMARQLDDRVKEQLSRLIDQFDGNNGERLGETMMAWANLSGLCGHADPSGNIVQFNERQASPKSMKNTLFIPPDMEEAHKRAKQVGQIKGTFNRRFAVEREDLIFFAPGDPFFDAIVQNAQQSGLGKSCAFLRKNSDVNWKGFVLTWSASMNTLPLLEKGWLLENTALAQGYMPLEQFTTIIGYDEEDERVDAEKIRQSLSKPYSKSYDFHLGKRGNGQIDEFRKRFSKSEWLESVERAYHEGLNDVTRKMKKRIDLKQAERDFQRKIDGLKASQLYYERVGLHLYDEELNRLKAIYRALTEGLAHPDITLESAVFVWLVKGHV
ncbi:MAG TPA: hypothetical protein VFK37_08525, partial [Bacillales bacterium]|nr:hypothetical protein [Bacillales bacterium]